MTSTLVLNKSHFIGNGVYRYNFPQGNVKIGPDSQICLSSLTVPYSWYNVTAAYGNNQFRINFPVGGGWIATTFTLQDGFYSVKDINNFLKTASINAGLYLIDASGNFIYFFEVYTNTTFYSNQLLIHPVPTAAEASALGYTAPSGFVYPTSAKVPYVLFNLPSLKGMATLLGFSNDLYPSGSQTTTQSFLSDKTPL